VISRKLHSFHGGVHPEGHKDVSNATAIQTLPLSPKYVVPLRQHIGAPARPLVQAGDRVLRGQLIGAPEGYVSTGVHAPTSGRVLALEPRPVPHPSGLNDLCVVIESDGEDRAIDMLPLDWRKLDPSALRNRLREMGLAGLGGAVFPSYIKLNPGRIQIETLILNGAECEPWITCDDRLMRERAAELLQGAAIMRYMLGASEILVGVEDNKPEAIAALREVAGDEPGVEVVAVPTCYPGGGGKQLAYTLTGKETPSKGITTDVGVQVFNVGTAYSLYRAIAAGEPMISRVVTCTGHVARPGNFEVRLGTPIADLIAAAGGPLAGALGEIVGGPMMGFDLMDSDAPVTKAVNCILLKSPEYFPPKPTPMPCIRCGACASSCPASLQPFELYWFSRAKDFGRTQSYHLFDCIECGCCSYVCPSHIPLVDFFRYAKAEIWEHERDKRAADQARERHEFKAFRLEREKQEKAAKFARAAQEQQTKAAEAGVDEDAAKKQALIEAALARAQESKAKLAEAGITPKNTEALSAATQAEIDAIEARREQHGLTTKE
jgi:electron transport complex protein RnfC